MSSLEFNEISLYIKVNDNSYQSLVIENFIFGATKQFDSRGKK